MKKIVLKIVLIVALFFLTWHSLSLIHWVELFKIEENVSETEQKLGDLFWDIFKNSDNECKNPFVINSVDSLVYRICLANDIEKDSIKIHILYNDEVNAFAMPNGHIIVYSGLILQSDNQEELCGVISHEIAHIQQNHVMKKLIKEVGLSTLISITTGSGNVEVIKEAAKLLSSTAYDRKLEKEADMFAVDYLINAKLNPEPFANFLYKISNDEIQSAKYFSWISTHPDSKERAEYIIEYSKSRKQVFEQIISHNTLEQIQMILMQIQ